MLLITPQTSQTRFCRLLTNRSLQRFRPAKFQRLRTLAASQKLHCSGGLRDTPSSIPGNPLTPKTLQVKMKCLSQRCCSSSVVSQRAVRPAFQLPGLHGQKQWVVRAQQQQVCVMGLRGRENLYGMDEHLATALAAQILPALPTCSPQH